MSGLAAMFGVKRALVLMLFVMLTGCSQSGSSGSAQELVVEAKKFIAEGKHRHALIKLKESVQKDPKMAESRLLLGLIYLGQNNSASAEIEIRKAMKLGIERTRWLNLLGRALLMQSHFDKVLKEIQISDKDDNAVKSQVAILRGDANLGLQKVAMARKQYLEAQLYDPSHIGPVFGLARVEIEQKQFAKGMSYLDKALTLNARHIPSWLAKGDVYIRVGRFDQAIEAYGQAVQINDAHPLALLKRAYAKISLGQVDAAQVDLNKVLSLYPVSALANFLNARINFLKGDIDKSSDLLQEVFRVDSEHLPSHLLKGFVALSKGSDRQAEQSLAKYLSAKPDHVIVSKLLSVVQLKVDDAESVIKRLKKVRGALQRDQEILALLGAAYLQLGQFESAEKVLKRSAAIKSGLIRDDESKEDVSGDQEDASVVAEIVLETDKRVFQKYYDLVLDIELERLLKIKGNQGRNHYLAGLLMLSRGDIDQARKYFQLSMNDKDYADESGTGLARLLIRSGQLDQAEKLLEQVLQRSPNDEKALVSKVQLLEIQGKKDAAVDWLKKSWQRNPKSSLLGMSLTKYYLQRKQYKEAASTSKRILAADKKNAGLARGLAVLYGKAGKYAEAIDYLQQTIKLEPAGVVNHLLLANMYIRQREFVKAESVFNSILQNDSDNVPALIGLVRLHIGLKQFAKARVVTEKIQNFFSASALGVQLQARIAVLEGNKDEALSLYRKAINIRPSSELVVAYAKLLNDMGQNKEAIGELNNWLFEYPSQHEVRFLLAGMYQQHKLNDKALVEYLLLEKAGAYKLVVLNNLIWILLDKGDASQLQVYVTKLDALNSKAPEILDTIGWAYLKMGQKDKAGQYLQQAVNKLPKNSTIQYHLAVYLDMQADKTGARKILKKILAAEQIFAEREDARKLLEGL